MKAGEIINMPFGLVHVPIKGLLDFTGKWNDSEFQPNQSLLPFPPHSLLCLGPSMERIDFEGQQRGWWGRFRFSFDPHHYLWILEGNQPHDTASFDDLALMIKRPTT